MINDNSKPLNYYAAMNAVYNAIPQNSIIVNEGANTMDIGRTIFLNKEPRTRLDAGTYGLELLRMSCLKLSLKPDIILL